MKEHIPNKTENLLSLSWESLGDSVMLYSNVVSETILTEVSLNSATKLPIISYRTYTRYGLSYGIVKINPKTEFRCALTGSIKDHNNNNIKLTDIEFEYGYLKSAYTTLDGVVIFHDNFNKIIELKKTEEYQGNISIVPPFYVCLKNQITTVLPNDIRITLGYMATYLPTTGAPFMELESPDNININTEEEFIEIE